ncbi:MAG: molybdate ABC transporter permease subunit [Candidatus Scalindua sp. AMX11]|nr:MAG: molybdate ABC transporter permease subunit [Candidatus Scalindua sp.]NOG83176.1 molybdate ABC transporter permease subunit [Planctomycetota bacterium]RZV77543.1 MAG: molybdate ABC transporter permease subunit [Candidatus Scalindua sp. SCAELEC01]TDE64577.1 MAG: molybdate ABC transporter permease subunit [Candidatus Scalindua sp. AMX11]GJQ58606.1 MAG: molybdenum ABC transporter permease subunit [Candidatus Scalindua sp.]
MILSRPDFIAFAITFKLAGITTLILLFLGTPLAWWLSRTQWRFKFLFEGVVALPLVLPPTVLGFYLLVTLGPNGPIGGLFDLLGMQPPTFTFTGLVIGSVLYSLPFVVQPLQDAFTAIGNRSLEVAATLRASPIDRFLTVAIPLARPGFLTATVLGFAHTVGEFGVVLMIGGNIPGKTQVLSIIIYDHVEMLEYRHAHWLSGGLLLLSFFMLITVYALNRRFRVVQM